jgi:hypothetical protein
MDTDHMVQWRKASVFGVFESRVCNHPTQRLLLELEAMLSNDTRHLERVEQYLLHKTQPERGCCRSLRPVTVYTVGRKVYSQNPCDRYGESVNDLRPESYFLARGEQSEQEERR